MGNIFPCSLLTTSKKKIEEVSNKFKIYLCHLKLREYGLPQSQNTIPIYPIVHLLKRDSMHVLMDSNKEKESAAYIVGYCWGMLIRVVFWWSNPATQYTYPLQIYPRGYTFLLCLCTPYIYIHIYIYMLCGYGKPFLNYYQLQYAKH